MNPFAEILAALRKSYQEVKARLNKALEGMPPIDQMEAAQPIRCLLGEYKWGMDRVEEMGQTIVDLEQRLDEVTKQATEVEIAARLESGELVTKDQSEVAIAAARKDERELVEGEVRARAELASTRRAEVAAAHGEHAARAMKDEDLLAGDYEARVRTLAARVATLEENGISADASPDAYVNILSQGYDAEGDAAFENSVKTIAALAGRSSGKNEAPAGEASGRASRGDVPPATPPAHGPSGENNAGGEGKPFIF